jgi:hypothetical protein
MLSGSFPIFALSNQTTFSQTPTGAAVPLTAILKSFLHPNVFRKQGTVFHLSDKEDGEQLPEGIELVSVI